MAIVWGILLFAVTSLISLGVVIGLLISPAIARVIKSNKDNRY